MSTLEDLLNDDSSDDDGISHSLSGPNLKNLDIEDLLDMKDDEDDDPAVLSSAIYEQFSHLMKTNEKIQRELATAVSNGSSPVNSPRASESIPALAKPVKDEEHEDIVLEGLDVALNLSSSDLLRHLVESEEDNDSADITPRSTVATVSISDAVGLAALKNAELKELRALQFSDKTVVSALQIRRSSTATSALSPLSSSGGAVMGGAVMTGIEELSLITNQLKKNASYQQHGPGLASCLSLCSRFIAVGTMKGFVLLFDHNQEIRKVLTHPNPNVKTSINPSSSSSAAASFPPLAVVALDSLSDGSMIVAAHRCGDVIFWDCAKGVVLKQLRDPSNADVISLKFLRPVATSDPRHTHSLSDSDTFHVLVLTSSSVINRYKLSKSLLLTWHCDVDCLLDESSGQVVAWAALSPFQVMSEPQSSSNSSGGNDAMSPNLVTSLSPTAVSTSTAPSSSSSLSRFYSDLRQQRGVVQLFAFSFPTQTCVVQSSPDVRIVFKWPNTNYSQCESKESRESLDWTWLSVPFDLSAPSSSNPSTSEGMVCAVLTRARETFIDMLVLRVKRTASSQSSVGANVNTDSSRMSGRVGGGRSSSIFMMVGNALTGGSVASVPADDIPSLSFECLTWLNRSVPNQHEHILAIKWIKASQLIAFTKTEVLLFDAGLTMLERCLLLPPISHAFLATIDRQSTVTTEIRPDVTVLNSEGYVLTSTACFKLFTKSPFEQANSLINSGRWLEGLSLIVENISKSPSLLTSEAEHIRRYIINYTLLAVKRIDTTGNADNVTVPYGKGGGVIGIGRHSRNHYHLVASVCSEYCVATKQLSLLYQEILDVFRIEGQADVLLESLEPFLLNRTISTLPTHILLAFFQMGVTLNKLQQVERCLIALNPRTLFPFFRRTDNSSLEEAAEADDIITRLFQQRLFSAFLYYYSIGKDDHVSAFQTMFQFLLLRYDFSSGGKRSESGELGRVALTSFEEEEQRRDLFYKLFLFLADVFEGKIFPTSEPVATFFSTCTSDEISYPFDSSQSSQCVEGSTTADMPLGSVKIVHGFQVNGMWSLLNLLATDQLPPFTSLSTADSVMSRDRYEQHSLHHLEFPLLYFFSRFDHVTLFQVLLNGFERIISLFTNSKDGTEPHFSSHHHLVIGGGGSRWETVTLSKEPISLSVRQKNEAKIVALLQNLFLFVKEEKERADVDGADSSASSEHVFFHFFQNFPPLLLRLPNAVLAPDFLHALISYHASARLTPPRPNSLVAQSTSVPFSAKKSEELLRALIESQLKLLLISSSGGGGGSGSKKFTIFSEKLMTSLSEADFHWAAFLVRKYYVKLFLLTSSTENDFTRQFRSYLNIIKQRRELGKSIKPTHSSLFRTVGTSTPSFSRTPVASSSKKIVSGDAYIGCEEGESEDVQEVLFAFILEGLEYFEREKSSAEVSSSFSSAWPSAQVVEQQQTMFREAVLEVVVELFELSVERTIDRVILPYFLSPSGLRALTDASKRNPALQFRALHYLIIQLRQYHDQNNTTFHIKHYLMNQELLYFLRLHCMFSPDHLLSFLKHYVFSSTPSTSTPLATPSSSRANDVILANSTAPSEEDLPLDEMAAILREFPQISDGIAFFEEMFGRIDEALTILLRDFSLKLKGVRKEIDGALRAESANTSVNSSRPSLAASSTSPSVTQLLLQLRALLSTNRSQWHKSLSTASPTPSSSSTQSHLQQLLGDMTSQLSSCRALRYSLTCISDLCERQLPSAFAGLGVNSTPESPIESSLFQRELAETMWYRAFDHLLHERQSLKEVTMSSSSQITSHFLMHLLQEFMNKMKTVISSQEIISRVLNHSSSSSSSSTPIHHHNTASVTAGVSGNRSEAKGSIVLGEFKEIMDNMIQSNAAELLLFQNMKTILHNDVRAIHQQKIRRKRAFVLRVERDETGMNSVEIEGHKSDKTETSTIASAWNAGSSHRRSSSRGKVFRLKDVKSMTNRAQEKLLASLPRTTLPTNLSDFSLSFEERQPGQLERKARYSVQIDVPIPWQ